MGGNFRLCGPHWDLSPTGQGGCGRPLVIVPLQAYGPSHRLNFTTSLTGEEHLLGFKLKLCYEVDPPSIVGGGNPALAAGQGAR
jgi:hypothetical protein